MERNLQLDVGTTHQLKINEGVSMYPFDLWLPHDIDIHSLKNNEAFTHRWERSWGGLRVNVACGNNQQPFRIGELINTIRLTRVGHEARYPHINVWLDINKVTDEFLENIRRVDDSVPRLNTFLIHRTTSLNITYLKDVLGRLKQYKLSGKLLILLSGDQDAQGRAIERIDVLSEAGMMPDVIFEHFPAYDVGTQTPIVNSLLNQLKEQGYNFSSHPLSLCGVVAKVCKLVFLGHFSKVAQDIVVSFNDSPFPNLGTLSCALEGIHYCYTATESLEHLNCSCNSSFSNILVGEDISSHITYQYSGTNDRILFEDWQYIYDGFEMV